MTQPDLTRLEVLLERANARRAHRQSIRDWNDGRIRARYEIIDELPALLARVRELEKELRICSNLLSATRPRDGYDLAWRCERAVTRARAALALNKETPDAG